MIELLVGVLVGLALRDIWPRALRPLRSQLNSASDERDPPQQLRP